MAIEQGALFSPEKPVAVDDSSEQENIPQGVMRGDIWQLGRHRLMCADSTNEQEVARLFDGEQFSLCFTSPPYSDQRTYKIGKFDWHSMMCGAFKQAIASGKADCHILINLGLSHKNRQVDMYWLQWLMECAALGWPVFGWYVWDKGAGLPGYWGGRLAPSHEFVFHFTKDNQIRKWVSTQERSRQDRARNSGFRRQGGNIETPHSLDKYGSEEKIPDSVIRINREASRGIHTANHPAVFPVALPEFIMQTWSQPDEIVYEPFCGSGTSLIAGENLQRRVYACEIEPSYVALAITRWQQATGQTATLAYREAAQ